MTPGAAAEPIEIEVHLRADGGVAMAREVRLGLTAKPKQLSPKYFYDERGSQLFEQITELDEYYPTRAERQILSRRSGEIIAAAGEPGTLVELGSGSAAKTRHLLTAMREAGCLTTYVPVDISEEITHETAESLVEEYPGLTIRGLVCDFEHDLERIPNGGGGRLVAFLGGTVGNLFPDARRNFLSRIGALLEPGDHILLGTDLVKEPERLEAAYDDPVASPPSSTRTSSRSSIGSSMATSTRIASSTWRATTLMRPAWTSACARFATRSCGSTGSTSPCGSRRGRRCAPRSPRSSRASGSTRSTGRQGCGRTDGSPIQPGITRSALHPFSLEEHEYPEED